MIRPADRGFNDLSVRSALSRAEAQKIRALVANFLTLIQAEFFTDTPKTGADRLFPGLTPNRAIDLLVRAYVLAGCTDSSRQAIDEIQSWLQNGAAQ